MMFQIIKNFKENELNPIIWFFFPLFILFLILLFKNLYFIFDQSKFLINFFQSEDGAVEITTFMLLIISIFISIFTLVKIKKKLKTKKEFFFLFIFLIGLIYFAGEEVSWGQHYFHWDTSNFFLLFNSQKETNIHNISSWFNEKPKTLLLLFIFFGGIIYPFFIKNSNNLLNEETQFTDWIFPTFCCFPSSIVCLFLYLLNKLYKLLCYGNPGVDLWESCNFIPDFLYFRTSEIIELYISIFFLIYILSINARLKKINN